MSENVIDILLRIKSDVDGLKRAQTEAKKLKEDLKGGFDFGGDLSKGLKQGLGLAGGLGVAAGIAKLTQEAARFVKAGIDFNATIEQQTVAFGTLLGSVEKAETRIKSLVSFATRTPFELPEIFAANKVLEVLSDGLLSTERGMTLVGDAASSVGREFRETGMWIGRLYAGLESGTAVGESTLRLIELGLISGKTAKELQRLAKTAHSAEEAWTILENTFGSAHGAMERQSETLKGLISNWKDFYRVISAEKTFSIFGDMTFFLREFLVSVGSMPSFTQKVADEVRDNFNRTFLSLKGATPETYLGSIAALDRQIAENEKKIKESVNRIAEIRKEEKSGYVTGPDGKKLIEVAGAFPTGIGSNEVDRSKRKRNIELETALANQKYLTEQIAALEKLRFKTQTESAKANRVYQAELNAEKTIQGQLEAEGRKFLSEGQEHNERLTDTLKGRVAILDRARLSDEERLKSIALEQVALSDIVSQQEKAAKTLGDEDNKQTALANVRLNYDIARLKLETEEVELKKKITETTLKAAKAENEYQLAIRQGQVDAIEHQKQIIELTDESATGKAIIRALDEEQKGVLAEMVVIGNIYAATLSDPKARQEIEKKTQALREQGEIIDANYLKSNRDDAEDTFRLKNNFGNRELDQIRHLQALNRMDLQTAANRQIKHKLIEQEIAILDKLIAKQLERANTAGLDPLKAQAAAFEATSLSQERDQVVFSSQEPTLLENSIAGLDALSDPAQHYQDAYGAATSALIDYKTQVGTVSDQIYDSIISIQESLTGSIADSIEGLIKGTMSWSDAFRSVGESIAQSVLTSFATMLAKWITTQITMLVMGKAFGQTAAIAAGIQATSLAAAWAPAATAASIATFGGAAALGTAAFATGLATGTGVATALAAAGAGGTGFAAGGYTGAGRKYDVAGTVHAGEFVMPRDVVSRKGAGYFYEQMQGIRDGKESQGGRSGPVNMIVVDSRKSAQRYLESSEGESRIIDIMELNKGRLI